MKRLPIILSLLLQAGLLRAQDSVATLAGQPRVIGAVNGTGPGASFHDPAAIVADAAGNFFLADSGNHAIRKVTTNGVVTTFAGRLGISGAVNGSGTTARFNFPSGLAFDKTGNLLVSDTGNNLIRKITPAGVVTTFAGVTSTNGGAFLDGATGTALFNSPLGLAVATDGSVFVADSGNHCIRKISGGVVSTFAGSPQNWGSANGNGTSAQFNSPCGLAFDARGDLFACDANNNTIRKITSAGVVSTFAGVAGQDGTTDGTLAAARFRCPAELAFDKRGNLFVTDSLNQTIRKIATNGIVATVSGTAGIFGTNSGVNGVGKYFNPYGILVAADGSLVVADTYNELVRVVLVPFALALKTSGGVQSATLTWDTVIGKNYQVQYQGSLSAPWINLGPPVKALNFTASATDLAPATPRFYRVVISP